MAVYTIVNTGGTWNSPNTWSPIGVPGASDDVISTASSGPLTVTANTSCKSIVLTGYTSTFTVNSGVTLTISGNTTFSSGMTVSGTGTLSMIETSTLTSAGKTWTGNLRFGGGLKTFTLGDSWTINGDLLVSATNTITINANSINVNGGYINSTLPIGYSVLGTTNINMIGSGTINCSSTSSPMGLNFTIDTTGTYTLNTFSFVSSISNRTLKYLNGNIIGSKYLVTRGGSFIIFDCSGMTWNAVVFGTGSPGVKVTLNSDFNVSNSIEFLVNLGANVELSGGKNLNFSGTNFTLFTFNNTSLSGNATINFYGSPNIVSPATSTVYLPFVFNCGSNTVTFPSNGNTIYRNSLTFNSLGSLVTTGNTLRLGSGSSVVNNVTGLTFNSISINGTTSFGGTRGFNMDSLIGSTSNASLGISPTNIYNINNNVSVAGTLTAPITLSSTTIGSRATLTLNNTPSTTQTVAHVNAIDIDSSSGATIWNYKGTLTNNLNWNSLSPITRNPNISSST